MPIHTDLAAARGWSATAKGLAPLSRRSFLRALGLTQLMRLRQLALHFTSVADDLAALMRWCACGAPGFAGAG